MFRGCGKLSRHQAHLRTRPVIDGGSTSGRLLFGWISGMLVFILSILSARLPARAVGKTSANLCPNEELM